jgi:hypothetical protein
MQPCHGAAVAAKSKALQRPDVLSVVMRNVSRDPSPSMEIVEEVRLMGRVPVIHVRKAK